MADTHTPITEVEALAEALYEADVAAPQAHRIEIARVVLASDWLADHDADVRRAVAEQVEAANVAPPEWMPNPIRSTGQEQYDAGYRAGIAALQAEIRRIIAGEVGARDG